MKYTYYPGCSLKGTGRAYEESLLAVMETLGVELREIDDWNCCGATAYMAVEEDAAFALAARNLALAEREEHDIVAPCSGCYLVLSKAAKYIREYPEHGRAVGEALDRIGLRYEGRVKIRHPLDVLVNDVGIEAVAEKATRKLDGLKVACYYGCQIVRPYATFDHQYYPRTMDDLVRALGAETIGYPLKTRCCGGSLTGTIPDVGLRLAYILLSEVKKRGADIVVTVCPLCHFNLDSYQDEIAEEYGDATMPVIYFTQLLGLALGLPASKLGLKRNIVPVAEELLR